MKISEILYGAVSQLEGVMIHGRYAEDFSEAMAAVRSVARALAISEKKAESKAKEETGNENQA